MNPLTSRVINNMEKSGLISKGVSVAKQSDLSPFIDLMAEGFASEMISVELKNGSAYGFPYSLLGNIHFDPDNCLSIFFSEHKIMVQGIKLKALYDYLMLHRVRILREADTHGFDLQNGKFSVKAISVEKSKS